MKRFAELIHKLANEPSINKKKEILNEYKDCKEVITYALDKQKKFYVTSAPFVEGASHAVAEGKRQVKWDSAKELLDKLHSKELTGTAAKDAVRGLLDGKLGTHQRCFLSILDKHLVNANVGKTLANKILGVKPPFEVALAPSKGLTDLSAVPYKNTMSSRKLDGVRCIAMCKGKDVKFYSRECNEFTSLEVLRKELSKWKLGNLVLDGEVCAMRDDGTEDFKSIVGDVKRKDEQVKRPIFYVFDVIPHADFMKGKGSIPFSQRYKDLQEIYNKKDCKCDASPIRLVSQAKLSNGTALKQMAERANKLGWEGLMLRDGDSNYVGKRRKHMSKVKAMHDAEFECVGVYDGEGQFSGTLGGIVIKVDEGETRCGTGFSKEQRDHWQEHPEELIGKKVTIQYFEKSTNKDGVPSLRFPVFKAVRNYE